MLVLAVVGAKSHRLVKAAGEVVEVERRLAARPTAWPSSRPRWTSTASSIDQATAQRVAEQVGDDVARVDALARTLQSIYGTAPLAFAHVEPYLGDAGDVPAWDLTDAIDAGDATKAIVVARRMLESRKRARRCRSSRILQRHYLNMARLEGSGARTQRGGGRAARR